MRDVQQIRLAGGAFGGGVGVYAAVAAFAFLEVEDGFEETGAIEIGPEGFGDENFGVGDLPEKEIADANFSAGADEEIGIGQIGGVEMACDFVFGYWRGVNGMAGIIGGVRGRRRNCWSGCERRRMIRGRVLGVEAGG